MWNHVKTWFRKFIRLFGPCLHGHFVIFCSIFRHQKFYPIGSMYAIYGNIYHQYTPNVSIYTIHGSYGYEFVVIAQFLDQIRLAGHLNLWNSTIQNSKPRAGSPRQLSVLRTFGQHQISLFEVLQLWPQFRFGPCVFFVEDWQQLVFKWDLMSGL
jgi:hypothetical protein